MKLSTQTGITIGPTKSQRTRKNGENQPFGLNRTTAGKFQKESVDLKNDQRAAS